jgi:hypothetical protein
MRPAIAKGRIHSFDQIGMNGAQIAKAPRMIPPTPNARRSMPWSAPGVR